MKQVHVVGLGVDPQHLSAPLSQIITDADVLVGGARLLAFFNDHPGEKVPVRAPLSATLETVSRRFGEEKAVVVLANGDPGFFGIGKRVVEALGESAVVLHPNVSTLQAAASRLKVPWQEIETVSLHGRKDLTPLLTALARNDRVAVFTDPEFNPAKIAAALLKRDIDAFCMHVFEDLDRETEAFGSYPLEQAVNRTFCPLSFVILDRTKPVDVPLGLGLNDELYLHQKGLITKKEIRAVGLSALSLRPEHTLWDLGTGSGSVAIEASVLVSRGRIYAVEGDPERVRQIRQNIRRTGAWGVEVIDGRMPVCLAALQDPDRIFMGGGMSRDTRVLAEAAVRLKPGGLLVLHLVLMGSLARAKKYMEQLGWSVSLTQIQVSRSRSLNEDMRLDSLNPVFIMCSEKPR